MKITYLTLLEFLNWQMAAGFGSFGKELNVNFLMLDIKLKLCGTLRAFHSAFFARNVLTQSSNHQIIKSAYHHIGIPIFATLINLL
ncbi:MAG: hypothetical protein ACLQQ4_17795 [Bacteroidia bacterium]